jgi:hypothetical protein
VTQFDDVDQLVQGSESTDPNVGKYFKVEVPNYANAGASEEPKVSYLRVGAARPDWQNEPGADLAALAYLVGTAGNQYGTELAEANNVVTALQKLYGDDAPGADELADPFVDDQRTRGRDAEAGEDDSEDRPNRAPGHGMSAEQRRARSANLHKDTGWREHTDGNRISTTRGDRIDVVYGNYKMVVMGRQSEPGDAMAWDVSGNHIQDFGGGTMPGASVTLEWVNTTYASGAEGGAWLLQNSTERVYQYSRNAGNFREEWWGDLLENYTGSEDPHAMGTARDHGMAGHPKKRDEGLHLGNDAAIASLPDAPPNDSRGLPRGNPTIVERTWATKIDSWTGSEKWPVPEVVEKEWVDRKTSESRVKHLVENTWLETQVSATHAGAIVESTNAGAIVESTIAGTHLSYEGSAAAIEIFTGLKLALELSGSVSVSALWKLDASFGWSYSFHNKKDEMALLENKLNATRNDLVMTANTIINTKAELAATKNELANTKTELANMDRSVTINYTKISTTTNILAVGIFLG